MNYYEHHLGDWAKNTAHLSLIEEGAFRRLIDRYYVTEAPLPADWKELFKLARARTVTERDAVKSICKEFFEERNGHFHNTRADEEIAKFQAGEPEREAKKQADADRQRRARERRSALFEQLRAANIVPPFKATTHELERLLSQIPSRDSSHSVTRDNTATSPQSPVPNPQSLIPINLTVDSARRADEAPPVDLLGHKLNGHAEPIGKFTPGVPDCPQLEVLSIWSEVMPDLPQHLPTKWKGTRAAHLRQRWREEAAERGWKTKDDGLAFFRKFLGWCRRSPFLMGKVQPRNGGRAFEFELAWLVNPTNWAKVHEGKFHSDQG